jgi:hypothetical protein
MRIATVMPAANPPMLMKEYTLLRKRFLQAIFR